MILNTISMPYNAGPTKKRKEGIPFFFFFHGNGNGNLQIKEEEKNNWKQRILENVEKLGGLGASAEEEEEEEENTYREMGLGRVYLV